MNNVQRIVVKLGGTAGVDFAAICKDVVEMIRLGHQIVLVHGGSEQANQLGEQVGIPPRFVTSPSGFTSRYTNAETMDVFAMAVNGLVNTRLVEQLRGLGIDALGLSGLDGGLVTAGRKAAIRIVENGKQKILREDYTGKIEGVNVSLLSTLLEIGVTPVIAPLAASEYGEALNVDGDRIAAAIAGALQAEILVLLTAVPGLMKYFPDESSLIRTMRMVELQQGMAYAQGRMKKKVLGAKEALQHGVGQVMIGDGRIEAPITHALNGYGTVITN